MTLTPARLSLASLVACASLLGACAVDMRGLSALTGHDGGAGTDGGIPGGDAAAGTSGAAGAGGTTGGSGGAGGAAGVGGGGAGGSSAACGPSTCPNGCCRDANTCDSGLNDQRCGNGGQACMACDPCYRCSSTGACELDPGANWDLICVSASVSATKPLGMMWDPMTAGVPMSNNPDPLCQLTLNGTRAARTPTAPNTFEPMWNASLTPTSAPLTESVLAQSGSWAVAVLDDDAPPNQTVTEPMCSVMPALTPADFAAGTVTLGPSTSCTAITIQLVCVQ